MCVCFCFERYIHTHSENKGVALYSYTLYTYIYRSDAHAKCMPVHRHFFMLINNIKCSNVIFIYAAELRFGRTGANDEVLNQNVKFHHICVAEPLKRIVFHWGEIITEGSFPLKKISIAMSLRWVFFLRSFYLKIKTRNKW